MLVYEITSHFSGDELGRNCSCTFGYIWYFVEHKHITYHDNFLNFLGDLLIKLHCFHTHILYIWIWTYLQPGI